MTRGCFVVLVMSLAIPTPSRAQGGPVEFSRTGWALTGEHTRIDTVGGRTVLRLRTGTAHYRAAALENGTIEFDMAVTPYRSFVYLTFRVQSDDEYEELYFRPHKSGLPDAMQYSPVYRGISNWQLYHGRGYTAAAQLPPGEWMHVRVVLRDSRAAVFVGEATAPQLVIPLAREPAPGHVSLQSFFLDPAAPEDLHGASFRNLVIRPADVPFGFSSGVAASAPSGTVTQWQVSRPFAPDSGTIEVLPGEVLRSPEWRTLPTDPRGVLVLYRHLPRLEGVGRPAALARLVVTADRERAARFDFGYSDEVSVFLNGALLFAGNDSYSFDEPRRDGLIGLDQGTLYLPLRRGTNELILAVSDVFGGWGVMGRFPDREGLEVGGR